MMIADISQGKILRFGKPADNVVFHEKRKKKKKKIANMNKYGRKKDRMGGIDKIKSPFCNKKEGICGGDF